MEEKKFNKKITYSVVAILLILLVAIGATTAYFLAQRETDIQTVTSGKLSIGFQTGDILRTSGIIPIVETDVDEKAAAINFTVTNTGNKTGYFNVHLTEINMDDELKNEDFRWRLVEGSSIISYGDFVGAEAEKELQKGIEITAGGSRTLKLLVWLHETNEPQNEMQGKGLSAKVSVNATDRIKVEYLTKLKSQVTTPKIPVSWDGISKIETGVRTTNKSQNILFCTHGAQYFGLVSGYRFNKISGSTNISINNLIDNKFHDLTISITNGGTATDYIALVWDYVYSQEVSYKYIKFYDKSNQLIYHLVPHQSGKFHDLISNKLLDMYNGPKGEITTDTYIYQNASA